MYDKIVITIIMDKCPMLEILYRKWYVKYLYYSIFLSQKTARTTITKNVPEGELK